MATTKTTSCPLIFNALKAVAGAVRRTRNSTNHFKCAKIDICVSIVLRCFFVPLQRTHMWWWWMCVPICMLRYPTFECHHRRSSRKFVRRTRNRNTNWPTNRPSKPKFTYFWWSCCSRHRSDASSIFCASINAVLSCENGQVLRKSEVYEEWAT